MNYARWSKYNRTPKSKTLYTALTSRTNALEGTDSSRLFDATKEYICRVVLHGPTPTTRLEFRTSREIFLSNDTLPYETDGLKSKKFKEAATQYTRTRRVPWLYRITDFTYSDDLGRIYNLSEFTGLLEFSKFSLTRRSGYRNSVWIRGYKGDVRVSAYVALSLSGLDPKIQSRVLVSSKYDTHHIAENLFDLRPSQLICLPTWMHRKIHSLPVTQVERELFVKKVNFI